MRGEARLVTETRLTHRTEHPRTSELLLLIISGVCVFATSFFAKWLPGANGRFGKEVVLFSRDKRCANRSVDDEVGSHKGPSPESPRRPRRYFPALLVFCIVARLEIFHLVSRDQQCSKAGVEVSCPEGISMAWFLTQV